MVKRTQNSYCMNEVALQRPSQTSCIFPVLAVVSEIRYLAAWRLHLSKLTQSCQPLVALAVMKHSQVTHRWLSWEPTWYKNPEHQTVWRLLSFMAQSFQDPCHYISTLTSFFWANINHACYFITYVSTDECRKSVSQHFFSSTCIQYTCPYLPCSTGFNVAQVDIRFTNKKAACHMSLEQVYITLVLLHLVMF
jgi:hypothetical protein